MGRFLAAFGKGSVDKLDKLVSSSGFGWWSTDSPGERIDPDARDRSTLMAYFAKRHAQHEQLLLKSFSFTGRSGNFGNFAFTLTRSADDGAPRVPYVGKGATDCSSKPLTLAVWSMARNPNP